MIGYIKTTLAVIAGALAGYAIGVVSVALSVPFVDLPGADLPAWASAAQQQYHLGVAGAIVCALAWIYIDYRYAEETQ